MTPPQIAIIAAMAQNRVIGINNSLPWRIPADLQHFKRLTMGHHMIMGRKTFESIGKALPGRQTIVISRNPQLQLPSCQIANSWQQARQLCQAAEKIFVVGGAEIYQLALADTQILYLTEIQQSITGDAYFPEIDHRQWQAISREVHQQQEPQALKYHFVEYHRR